MFDGALVKSDVTTSHCRVAGTPDGSFEGVKIGRVMTAELERLDRPASPDDVLLSLSAKPVEREGVGHEEKKSVSHDGAAVTKS